jgi:hypothetical protein
MCAAALYADNEDNTNSPGGMLELQMRMAEQMRKAKMLEMQERQQIEEDRLKVLQEKDKVEQEKLKQEQELEPPPQFLALSEEDKDAEERQQDINIQD